MKIFKLLVVLILLFNSCKENDRIKEDVNTSENIDEDFNIFLEKFNRDSIFQISRINFPLKVIERNDENLLEETEKTIELKEYEKIDLSYPKDILTREFDRYRQNIKLSDKKATIEIRGVDNGIYINIYFEKEGGKWILTSWTDKST